MVLSRNEPFIELSLKSIESLADEIIVVDASRGRWAEETEKICEEEPKIRYLHTTADYREQTKIGLLETAKRWVLKWDADFIAFPHVMELRKLTESLERTKHYAISFPVQNLEWNFFYTNLSKPLHYEPYLFTYSFKLLKKRLIKYYNIIALKFKKALPNRDAYTPFPFWYNNIRMNKTYALHLNTIKPPMRLVEKQFQAKWALMSRKQKGRMTFEQFVKRSLVETQMTPEEVYLSLLKTQKVRLYRGMYPELLKRWIEEKLGIKFEKSVDFNSRLKDYLIKISRLTDNEIYDFTLFHPKHEKLQVIDYSI